jgi:hypothetical protein
MVNATDISGAQGFSQNALPLDSAAMVQFAFRADNSPATGDATL